MNMMKSTAKRKRLLGYINCGRFRIFQMRRANLKGGDASLLFWPFFPKITNDMDVIMLINKCWSLFQWKWPPQVPPSPQPSGPSPPRDAVESQQMSSSHWTPVAPSGGRTLTHSWDSSRTLSGCSTSPRRPPTSGSSPLALFPRITSSWTNSTRRKMWVPGLHYRVRRKPTLSRNIRQKCLVLSVLLLNNPKHTRQLSRKLINWLDCRVHAICQWLLEINVFLLALRRNNLENNSSECYQKMRYERMTLC